MARRKQQVVPTDHNRESRKRDQTKIRSVNFRFDQDILDKLDMLCHTNVRSRRVIMDILIDEAYAELQLDPSARLIP